MSDAQIDSLLKQGDAAIATIQDVAVSRDYVAIGEKYLELGKCYIALADAIPNLSDQQRRQSVLEHLAGWEEVIRRYREFRDTPLEPPTPEAVEQAKAAGKYIDPAEIEPIIGEIQSTPEAKKPQQELREHDARLDAAISKVKKLRET